MAGDLAAAEGEYRAILDAIRGAGSDAEREVMLNLARLCANDGREFEALALAARVRDDATRAGDGWRAALSLLQLANALDAIEDYERIPPLLDRVEGAIAVLSPDQSSRLRLSVALHRARLAANLGDVGRARAEVERAHAASSAVNGHRAPPRLTWLVNIVALNVAGRFTEAAEWLDTAPPSEGIVRRELEYAEQRVRCLLGAKREPDGTGAAAAFLTALRGAPAGTIGPAWRLRAATDLGTRLAAVVGSSEMTREAWDLAGREILMRVLQIENGMRTLPEVAAAGNEVHDLLTGYRERFRDRHEQLLREVGAARPWPPVDAAMAGIGPGMAVACAWCTRVRSADRQWVPIRQFLPERDGPFAISHGICAACWERSVGDLAAYAAQRHSLPRGGG